MLLRFLEAGKEEFICFFVEESPSGPEEDVTILVVGGGTVVVWDIGDTGCVTSEFEFPFCKFSDERSEDTLNGRFS